MSACRCKNVLWSCSCSAMEMCVGVCTVGACARVLARACVCVLRRGCPTSLLAQETARPFPSCATTGPGLAREGTRHAHGGLRGSCIFSFVLCFVCFFCIIIRDTRAPRISGVLLISPHLHTVRSADGVGPRAWVLVQWLGVRVGWVCMSIDSRLSCGGGAPWSLLPCVCSRISSGSPMLVGLTSDRARPPLVTCPSVQGWYGHRQCGMLSTVHRDVLIAPARFTRSSLAVAAPRARSTTRRAPRTRRRSCSRGAALSAGVPPPWGSASASAGEAWA